MATKVVLLSDSQWTRLTDAGQSGTCWKRDGQQVRVDHTDQETADTLSLSNTNVAINKSKRVPLDEDGLSVLCLPADNNDDIYYGVVIDDGSAEIVLDVV